MKSGTNTIENQSGRVPFRKSNGQARGDKAFTDLGDLYDPKRSAIVVSPVASGAFVVQEIQCLESERCHLPILEAIKKAKHELSLEQIESFRLAHQFGAVKILDSESVNEKTLNLY